MKKTQWLRNTLTSIRQHCPVDYKIKLLCIGTPDAELSQVLDEYAEVLTTIVSPINLGCGGGRNVLTRELSSELAMMLDDDMYLTRGAIEHALNVFREHEELGAIAYPSMSPKGQLFSGGGRHLIIKDGVISKVHPSLDSRDLITLEDLDGGAMLLRTEMLKDFRWDGRYMGGFDDLDKSLQIMYRSKWKQAILPHERLIHDRSWVDQEQGYAAVRLNGLAIRKSYRLFRKKWRLRLSLRDHLYFELIYPMVTIVPWPGLRAGFDKFVREKRGTRHISFNVAEGS